MSKRARRSEAEELATMTRRDLLPHVRAWVQARLSAGASLRALEVEIGIGRSSINQIATGQRVTPEKNWPKLRAWYLQDREQRGQLGQDTGTMALILEHMVAEIPQARRPQAIQRIVDELAGIYRAAYVPVPAWLEQVRPAEFPRQAGEQS